MRLAGVSLIAAYAWIVAGLAHFTWPTLAAVLVPGVLVLALASRRRRPRPTVALHPRGIAPWAGVLAAVVTLEVWAWSRSPRDAYPTLSSIADAVLEHRPVAAAAFLAWLALGWNLARR
jgi:hypothetical protein